MAITRHTGEIRLQGPTKQPSTLSTLYATLPMFFTILSNAPDRRTLEQRRKELVSSFTDRPFEEVKEFALKVFHHKTLRGVADEAAMLAEIARWEPYHFNATQLSGRE
jgi:hypothetical protein